MKRLLLALLGTAFALRVRAGADPVASLKLFVERETSGLPGRVEIVVGTLDPRTRPAPCTRVVPFVPSGTKLWGRATIGLKCEDGAPWSAYLPVQISVHAPALVAARSLSAGQALHESDFRLEEVDLTREPPGLVGDAGLIANMVLSRPLAGGQAVRREHLRARPVVVSGDPVRVVVAGAGFSVSTDAKALAAATDGETVRVQTASGRVLTGVARPGRTVEIRRP